MPYTTACALPTYDATVAICCAVVGVPPHFAFGTVSSVPHHVELYNAASVPVWYVLKASFVPMVAAITEFGVAYVHAGV